MEELDELIFSEIRKLSLAPEEPKKQEDHRDEIISSEIRKIERQIDRLIDLYSLGNLSVNSLNTKIGSLNAQKAKLELELDSLRKSSLKDKTAFKRQIESFSDMLEAGTADQIRRIVKALIRRIELDGEDIYIYWNFS